MKNDAKKFFGNVRQSDKMMFAFGTFFSVVIFENRTPHTDVFDISFALGYFRNIA